jgi:DNA processing protein
MSEASNREPWLRLLLSPELRKPQWIRLHLAFGSPEAILGARAAELRDAAQLSDEAARAILRGPEPERLETEQRLIEETGASVVTFADERYPELLRRCSAPPLLLYVQSEFRPEDRYAIVVVGSRAMSQYGKLACTKIVADLVGAGVTIISGMAYGVDTVAHETALRHGGRTIAVLAQGLAARDSSQRVDFRRRITDHGAVVSEFPMTAAPERYNYPTRNHTMAALGLAAVIVEAQEKSGALITAHKALEENRQVFAVPGDITRQTSGGTNSLIREGAVLVRGGHDILADLRSELKAILRESGLPADSADAPPLGLDTVSPVAQTVWARVRREPIYLDLLLEELAEEGLTVGTLSTALLELEMKGLVRHLPGNLYTTERAS